MRDSGSFFQWKNVLIVGSKRKRWRLLPKVEDFSGISLKPLGRQLQSQAGNMTPTHHGPRATSSRHSWMACQIPDQPPAFTPEVHGEGSLHCRWVWHRYEWQHKSMRHMSNVNCIAQCHPSVCTPTVLLPATHHRLNGWYPFCESPPTNLPPFLMLYLTLQPSTQSLNSFSWLTSCWFDLFHNLCFSWLFYPRFWLLYYVNLQ